MNGIRITKVHRVKQRLLGGDELSHFPQTLSTTLKNVSIFHGKMNLFIDRMGLAIHGKCR